MFGRSSRIAQNRVRCVPAAVSQDPESAVNRHTKLPPLSHQTNIKTSTKQNASRLLKALSPQVLQQSKKIVLQAWPGARLNNVELNKT